MGRRRARAGAAPPGLTRSLPSRRGGASADLPVMFGRPWRAQRAAPPGPALMATTLRELGRWPGADRGALHRRGDDPDHDGDASHLGWRPPDSTGPPPSGRRALPTGASPRARAAHSSASWWGRTHQRLAMGTLRWPRPPPRWSSARTRPRADAWRPAPPRGGPGRADPGGGGSPWSGPGGARGAPRAPPPGPRGPPPARAWRGGRSRR